MAHYSDKASHTANYYSFKIYTKVLRKYKIQSPNKNEFSSTSHQRKEEENTHYVLIHLSMRIIALQKFVTKDLTS